MAGLEKAHADLSNKYQTFLNTIDETESKSGQEQQKNEVPENQEL